MAELTPMMRQYMEIKEQNPDSILFFRLGDFYEMFNEDAKLVSKELDLTLTSRDRSKPKEEQTPMCGVPYHSVDAYIARLVQKGYKVAICEQMEDPALAKGLVERDITRIITPGTVTESCMLEERKNNYMGCVFGQSGQFGLAFCDLSTGAFFATTCSDPRAVASELGRFTPSEVLRFGQGVEDEAISDVLFRRLSCCVDEGQAEDFDFEKACTCLESHFGRSVEELGLASFSAALTASGALLQTLLTLQKNDLKHIRELQYYTTGRFMELDLDARRNLELTETMRSKEKKGTLLWVLDKTHTAMGGRMLRSWLEKPLLDPAEITRRHAAVEALVESPIARGELEEALKDVTDLERVMTRIVTGTVNCRDLLAFARGLRALPQVKTILEELGSPLLQKLAAAIDPLADCADKIEKTIVDDPPLTIREGGIIRKGANADADRLRDIMDGGSGTIAAIEASEREKTGIKTMKVKYNKVFGYYLEVTNSYKDLVPDYFTRKQTLANAERYITPELKELEDMILGAEDKLINLEYDLFCEVRNRIAAEVVRIQKTAKAVAKLDAFVSLAVVADQNNYCRPKINENGVIDIKDGRHPVVEKMMNNDMFIANDTYLDNGNNRISIITGPNMAGKSTYMRQTAIIVLMAQIGSFVPASSAKIGIVDRIFTRVGASDDLASGQSTFMVEMNEVANILRNATSNSLLVLDEIGRGTSTFDGLSIAWAVVEHISNPKLLGAKTLFATHYHELTELEGKLHNVNNYCIAVKEKGDDIVFLRKIVRGGADKSYGIQVAKLAGVPDSVIERAKQIVEELSANDITAVTKNLSVETGTKKKKEKLDEVDLAQMSLFDTVKDDDILEELKSVDLSNMTPIDALNKLYELQNKIKNRW